MSSKPKVGHWPYKEEAPSINYSIFSLKLQLSSAKRAQRSTNG